MYKNNKICLERASVFGVCCLLPVLTADITEAVLKIDLLQVIIFQGGLMTTLEQVIHRKEEWMDTAIFREMEKTHRIPAGI